MKLTKRELDVMKILWSAKKPLMVSEIVQLDNDSTIYSVQRLISNLLKKGMIEVDSIVFNQKALARKFKPTANAENVEIELIQDMLKDSFGKDIPASHLIAALLPNDSSPEALNELADLEKIISDRISELLTEKNKERS